MIEDFEKQHGIHGLLIGGVVYWWTDSLVAGMATGGLGLYYYMSNYGHNLEPFEEIFK